MYANVPRLSRWAEWARLETYTPGPSTAGSRTTPRSPLGTADDPGTALDRLRGVQHGGEAAGDLPPREGRHRRGRLALGDPPPGRHAGDPGAGLEGARARHEMRVRHALQHVENHTAALGQGEQRPGCAEVLQGFRWHHRVEFLDQEHVGAEHVPDRLMLRDRGDVVYRHPPGWRAQVRGGAGIHEADLPEVELRGCRP